MRCFSGATEAPAGLMIRIDEDACLVKEKRYVVAQPRKLGPAQAQNLGTAAAGGVWGLGAVLGRFEEAPRFWQGFVPYWDRYCCLLFWSHLDSFAIRESAPSHPPFAPTLFTL